MLSPNASYHEMQLASIAYKAIETIKPIQPIISVKSTFNCWFLPNRTSDKSRVYQPRLKEHQN
ncbi:6792_t:CDS:2 [Ambispora gerdemannii]|uniref:6792_t:CDS:1 n=1 Tax=Ambispora gerdemannii TaxID=144530 RepID=A0A9N9BRY6_9GLOM|nr:6792_t:CDS:2 [Ambispora gerdemannii]